MNQYHFQKISFLGYKNMERYNKLTIETIIEVRFTLIISLEKFGLS